MQTAIEWYTRGYKLGDARATHHLAVIHMAGNGVTRDRKKAIDLYEKAIRIADNEVVRNFADVLQGAPDDLIKMSVAMVMMDDPYTEKAMHCLRKYLYPQICK